MSREIKHIIALGIAVLMVFIAHNQFSLKEYFTNPELVAVKCLVLSTMIVIGMFLVLYLTRDIDRK